MTIFGHIYCSFLLLARRGHRLFPTISHTGLSVQSTNVRPLLTSALEMEAAGSIEMSETQSVATWHKNFMKGLKLTVNHREI
jgi:hypothetical protein